MSILLVCLHCSADNNCWTRVTREMHAACMACLFSMRDNAQPLFTQAGSRHSASVARWTLAKLTGTAAAWVVEWLDDVKCKDYFSRKQSHPSIVTTGTLVVTHGSLSFASVVWCYLSVHHPALLLMSPTQSQDCLLLKCVSNYKTLPGMWMCVCCIRLQRIWFLKSNPVEHTISIQSQF